MARAKKFKSPTPGCSGCEAEGLGMDHLAIHSARCDMRYKRLQAEKKSRRIK